MSNAAKVLLLALAEGVAGEGLPEQGHAIKCVLASIEVSQLDIERTCYAPIADIQDMLEVDEARVRHFIETGQLETFLFEGDQLVILESDNMCEARMQRLERFEESGKGIDWDW